MTPEWFYRIAGVQFGPVTAAELMQQAAVGRIVHDTEVRKHDTGWVAASQVAGLFNRPAPATSVPAAAPAPPPATAPTSRNEEWTYSQYTAARPQSNSGPGNSQTAQAAGGLSLRGAGHNADETYQVLESAEGPGIRIEVLAYPRLSGAKDYHTAATVYFANEAGIRLKQVRITLQGGEAITESGALHFMHGRIQMESKIGGVAGMMKAMMNTFVTKESAVMPRYRGTGRIYLEPSFSHFLICRLYGEEVIADKGMFYCAEGTLEVGWALQRNVSSALFGGEGFFQTKVSGSGLCVFESPVPMDEVVRVDLRDETLQVDGNFALMRTGGIEFSVEKSTRSLLGTLTSGEGLLQTFRGTGSVWLAPTQGVYRQLQTGGIGALAGAGGSSHTAT